MSSPSEVTPALLREWGLPDPGDSKKSRGRVMVVGGSRRSPGAVLLAGEAALRVGAGPARAGRPASVEAQLGLLLPEAAVFRSPATRPTRSRTPSVRSSNPRMPCSSAPGFDDADETRATLLAVARVGHPTASCSTPTPWASCPTSTARRLPADLMLNPNDEEAAILLDRELGDDRTADLLEIARRFDAVVNCYGIVATRGRDMGGAGGRTGTRHVGQRRRAGGGHHRLRRAGDGARARRRVGELGPRSRGRSSDRADRHRDSSRAILCRAHAGSHEVLG